MLAPRSARTLLVAVALTLPLGLGCNKQQQLTEVEVPEAGLTLRYDLTPGQVYEGHVRMRTAAQTPVGEIITIMELDVSVTVSGQGDDQGRPVDATVSGIEVELRVPDGIPPGMTGVDPEAAEALDGMQLRFDIDARGDVSNEPEPPEGMDPQTAGMVDLVTSAVTAGFSVRLPEETIEDGASWDSGPKELDDGVKSAKSTGTFGGLGRNAAGDDIAKLSFESTTESERSRGGMTLAINSKASTEATFSASGGHPVSVERSINNEIVGQATVLVEIDATWTKAGKTEVPAAATPTSAEPSDAQEITDPCDPDYAGMGECLDDGEIDPAG